MRVLLVRPPSLSGRSGLVGAPLGLAYVAAALQQAGHQVRLVDARGLRMTWGVFEGLLAGVDADVLGLTVYSPLLDEAARTLAASRAPHVLVGGPHPSAVGEAVFADLPGCTMAVVGEGEEAAPRALEWLEAGAGGDPPAGVRVPGRPFNAARSLMDVSDLVRPARDLLPMGAYRYPLATHPRSATVVSSRGCPRRCIFCDHAVMGYQWRGRSAADVLDEVSGLVSRYGVGFVNFYDDDFLHDRQRVRQICAGISHQHPTLEWKCEARVDQVDAGLLRVMRAAGCRVLALGMESAQDGTLAWLGKGFTAAQAAEAVGLCRQAGLRVLAYVLVGVPGESWRDGLRTVQFCRRVGVDYLQVSSLAVMPGTPLARQVARGVVRDVPAVGAAVNPLDSESRRVVASSLSAGRLNLLLRAAWMGFYLRPGPIIRLSADLCASGSWTDALRLAFDGVVWAMACPGREPTRSTGAGAR